MEVVHRNIVVTGKVQGVFYRATSVDVARQLGLKGFVQNERNGDVYIEVEGPEEIINKLIDWCRKGPARAQVSSVVVTEGPTIGYRNFDIRR